MATRTAEGPSRTMPPRITVRLRSCIMPRHRLRVRSWYITRRHRLRVPWSYTTRRRRRLVRLWCITTSATKVSASERFSAPWSAESSARCFRRSMTGVRREAGA
ncbi:MAG: hypothetical protein IIZ06_08385 [Kiritimatiellae bacterium]|nr:hypothetical protein [Kiritimatiellia bacterium]